MPLRILIADPEPDARESLQLLLAPEEHQIVCVASEPEVLSQLGGGCFDVILCSVQLRAEGGDSSLVRWLSRRQPDVAVIATSGSGGQEADDFARREGAYDHLSQPFTAAEVLHALDRGGERQRLRCAAGLLERELHLAVGDRPVVAASATMIELLERIERAAAFQAPTLLCGEPGTGKEGLARVIHAQSPRRHRPFAAISCISSSEDLLERELFGCLPSRPEGRQPLERGLFLQAIEEQAIHPRGAAKPRVVDVRIIASTCRDLHACASIGEFSADLLKALEGVQFSVPALRDRKQDIPLLVDHFFARARSRLGRSVRSVSDEALESLVAYHWPGNIRELENAIERAVLVTNGGQIRRRDLPEGIVAPLPDQRSRRSSGLGLKRARKRLEARLIRRALHAAGGNRTHAAKLLEISHRALLYKIKEYRSEIE
jgi:two-component system response regulator AtoC